ncbi:sigma-70 family RNA polymerase sigma factor [Pelagovum pacificum]|uniref:Sigma-70 family RNA polymerase sigma factor n=1 Tax=Pelagovum pacificum TaxID=2588711 RepID=A0A5C5GA35_9RHOB|nr:sigma-70 family RNA polymerase sigma factor [Pelagovum pacificum]QQA41589.1 sigma-70 family RNA polymerase sigma factor [Pelagovum pacificum]TNY30868.1 sigma-70 family RNA polymerase sigma factor [Pelagovum pacificum]
MAELTDIEGYISRVALGDRQAFASLYDETSAKLFGVALRVLNDRAEAEECTQEVYIRIWKAAGRYQQNGLSPMTWLITIARNRAIDRLRARKSGSSGLDEAGEIPDAGPGPEALAIASSERGRIMMCMSELPDERAEAIRRVYLDGETYNELATHFDVPLNTMRTWLRRGLQKLKECLTR